MNFPVSTVSLSLLKDNPFQENSNEYELLKIKNLVDTQINKGHKYPLLACIFLCFYDAGKSTLTKSELYDLMAKRTAKDINKIVSSPTERYSIVTPNNFKSKIKDIIKKKKWFNRVMNNNGEIEYTLNEGILSQITPKIESYCNIIESRDSIFQNNSRGLVDNNNNLDNSKPKIGNKKRANNNLNNNINNNINNNLNMSINDINNINNLNNPLNNMNYISSISSLSNPLNNMNHINSFNSLNNLNAMNGMYLNLNMQNNFPNGNNNLLLPNNDINSNSNNSNINALSLEKKKKKNNNYR